MIDLCGAITFDSSNHYRIENSFDKILYYNELNKKSTTKTGENFTLHLFDEKQNEYFENKDLFLIIFGEVFYNLKTENKNKQLFIEQLYKLYNQYGIDFYKYIKGTFNVVIYDKRVNTAYIVSDRFNIIPLFYFFHKKTLFFSSSLKALAALNKIDVSINYSAIVELLLFHTPLGNKTLYNNVYMQNPASLIEAGYNGVNESKYWNFYDSIVEKFQYPFEYYLEEGSKLFYDSVNKYLNNEDIVVPLSGGYDTRTIFSVLNYDLQKIYSFSFGLKGCDDIEIPLKIKEKLGINYSPVYLDKGEFEKRFNEMAYNAIFYSDGLGNISRANNVYGYYMYSKYANSDISGLMGSEILKKIGNTVAISHLLKYFFLYRPSLNNFKLKVYEYCSYNFINYDFIKNYIGNIYKDLYLRYLERFSGKYNRYYIYYIYLFEEGFRKYFMQDIRTSRYFIDVKLPFLDSDFLEFIFQSPFASIYRTANEINDIRYKYNRHLFYSYVIKKYYPELADIPTNHYQMKPKNQMGLKELMKDIPKYFYYKLKKNNNKLYNYEKWTKYFFNYELVNKDLKINELINFDVNTIEELDTLLDQRDLFKIISLDIYLSNQ